METLEITPVIYSLGSEYTDNDFVDTNHIKNIVMDRVLKQKSTLEGQYLYSLTLSITPTRTDYHIFTMEKLQEVSRKLTNGMMTLGMVSNRRFWNEHHTCGVRTTSICDDGMNDYPTFSLNYVLCGREDNNDVKLLKQMTLRIRMIDPRLTFRFQYLGQFTPDLFGASLNYQTDVDYNNPVLKKLGDKTIDEIYHNQFQRPRFLGGLYKLNPSTI
jgi:hypothetical protein